MTGTTGIAETTPAPPIARPAPIAESDKRRGGIATGEALAVLATAASMAALAVGCVSLPLNSMDPLRLPAFFGMALLVLALAGQERMRTNEWPVDLIVIGILSVIGGLIALTLPEYTYGHNINGIIHRTMFTALMLLPLGTAATCATLYRALGSTPSAWDASRYPLILLPLGLAFAAYGAILLRLLSEGLPDLSWHLISTPYKQELTGGAYVTTVGLRNHIMGTLLLVAMVGAFSLPVGMGAGIYIAEYDDWVSKLIRFSTFMLRAISVLILGLTALALVDYSRGYDVGSPISDYIRGSYRDFNGVTHAGGGTYLTATLFLSMLAIPVIARTTEEGFRSVPREVREGSVALGATDTFAFRRILVPWAMPSVITGLLIGCAEAAGSVAVLLFIAARGEYGVSPLNQVTSLGFMIYDGTRGDNAFTDSMGPYRYSAALVLIALTFALSLAAIILKQRFAARYRSFTG